jgi:hypothetical protein
MIAVGPVVERLSMPVPDSHFSHWKLIASKPVSGIIHISYSIGLLDWVLRSVKSNSAPMHLIAFVRLLIAIDVSNVLTVEFLAERCDIAHALAER